jgi:glycosyltransferase involved in cell wall biosynthesis
VIAPVTGIKPIVSKPLRILLFGSQMAIGGAQKLLLEQARWFHEHGHDVTAVFFYDKQGLHEIWQREIPAKLLTMTELDSNPSLLVKFRALAIGMLRLWRLLRMSHFDAIETFTYDSNLLALPVAWLAGVRARIATHHGIIEGFPRWVERVHAMLINLGAGNILVGVSRRALEQAERAGVRPERLTVIPNGIALPSLDQGAGARAREELGLPVEEILILSAGRLVYQKGHEFLIMALALVRERFPGVRVAICGDGILRAMLKKLVIDKALDEAVYLLGNRNDMRRLLAAADIFALPSRWEGLPVALLEAMGMGLPVVATRVEGVEDVVRDGTEGALVPPGDIGALASALADLVDHPEKRRKMGRAARARVRDVYTLDKMCEDYLALMRRFLAADGE